MRVRDRGVARGEEVVGHDFRKRKLLTQPHHLVRSVLRNLSAHPSQRHPCDYGHDFCKAKVAMPPHCLVLSMKAAK